MKDIKNIRPDFHLAAWVMPQGGDLGGWGGQKNVFRNSTRFGVCYLHNWHMHRHHFFSPSPLGPLGGPKAQISSNLNYKVNFKDF